MAQLTKFFTVGPADKAERFSLTDAGETVIFLERQLQDAHAALDDLGRAIGLDSGFFGPATVSTRVEMLTQHMGASS